MKKVPLKLIPRKLGSKSELKRMRKQGYIPVEVYGKEVENRHAYVSLKDLMNLPYGETFLIEADLDGEKRVCLLKDIQRGYLGDDALHVDLYDISHTREIEVEVPLEFVGTPAGVSLGGTFEVMMHTLTIKAPVDNIPDKVSVDVSSMGLGDVLHVRDIQPPAGCIIMDSPEEVVAVVLEPEVEETPTEETAS
ncbi:50S ribosomal protein L25/general stress protein Ctc [Hydrogenobacter hydrogenophilus]|uniref:Large ribosomal subunit protein bL25 n=1 Tax=Hydrogenobacter hydrogenophilus TaxID=35835 RepID=A0A285NVW1_9AQUI|nr:50S ribosomal protein L25/general stress protein Ctc [Hydrogenobacter hydrogenophilus]SNZ12026.1 large subunit ribosomal protein L25 [Hydrogenobacter hydrogenophilus]